MNTDLIGSSTKMSVMITEHPELVMLLQRMDIALGFGERSVRDVCARHGVDTDFFILLCNVYSDASYAPREEDVLRISMDGLIPYLRRSHEYYVSKRLTHIQSHLGHIAEQLPQRVAQVFMRFFDDYRREVTAHFSFEENVVFPHITSLQEGQLDTTYHIDTFLQSHENLEDKLGDLLQIVFKYLPEQATGDDAVDVVYDILQLSMDLNRHSLIEEKVMVPYVRHLERSLR
ncbi:MAG: hemerythrin domain-containing protein [Muribaculaceae bacterium]|nr:hemerythrin domain-containing protein [Muribaculaceae bacterium]